MRTRNPKECPTLTVDQAEYARKRLERDSPRRNPRSWLRMTPNRLTCNSLAPCGRLWAASIQLKGTIGSVDCTPLISGRSPLASIPWLGMDSGPVDHAGAKFHLRRLTRAQNIGERVVTLGLNLPWLQQCPRTARR
jgi:hypothetical protein